MTATLLDPTYPLTPLQEGMLFHSRLATGAGLYVQQLAVTLPEEIDADALRQAWQFVADRHAALRTTFPNEDGQTVADEVEVLFEEVDWRSLPSEPDAQARVFQNWLTADRLRE